MSLYALHVDSEYDPFPDVCVYVTSTTCNVQALKPHDLCDRGMWLFEGGTPGSMTSEAGSENHLC